MTAFPESTDPDNDLTVLPETREWLGRVVRQVWVNWAREQDNPKPSWLLPWEELDCDQREVDMRIGDMLYNVGRDSILAPLESKRTDLLNRIATQLARRVNDAEPDDGAYDMARAVLPVVEDEVRRRTQAATND